MYLSLLSICASLLSAPALIHADYSGPNPAGNPTIHPALSEQVPRGEAFNITWKPTGADDVKLTLLRGPTTNVQPLHTIVQHTPNTGSFEWQVPTDLEVDKTHYGLEISVVAGPNKGQFQYSPQFGIAVGKGGDGDDNASESASASTTGSSTSTSAATTAPAATGSDAPGSPYPADSAAGKTSVMSFAGVWLLVPLFVGIMA